MLHSHRRGVQDIKKKTVDDIVRFVKLVVDNLNNRFPNATLLKAVQIFDPKSLPLSIAELSTYGEEH